MDRDKSEKHNANIISTLQMELRSKIEKMEYQRVTSEERAKSLEYCIGETCVCERERVTLLFSRMDSLECYIVIIIF